MVLWFLFCFGFFGVSAQDNLESESFQIECLKDGTWSNKIPVCKSKETPRTPCRCPFPAEISHWMELPCQSGAPYSDPARETT